MRRFAGLLFAKRPAAEARLLPLSVALTAFVYSYKVGLFANVFLFKFNSLRKKLRILPTYFTGSEKFAALVPPSLLGGGWVCGNDLKRQIEIKKNRAVVGPHLVV